MDGKMADFIGPIPDDHGLGAKMRFHQGWWRAFVLCEDPGPHPKVQEQVVCNTIKDGETSNLNFISDSVADAVNQTLDERKKREDGGRGAINEDRLFNNLLSSQPLCFNFFGEFKSDRDFAVSVLRAFFPSISKVEWTQFEYGPEQNFTADNSAFDVAFEVEAGNKKGFIGLECKFTDDFSTKEYNKTKYQEIYTESERFASDYEDFIVSRYNQLFRNQLMAEALVINGVYDFVYTGLFCHPDDEKAIKIANEFRSMLNEGEEYFNIITYQDFLDAAQRLELSRDKREMLLMLWARYCGIGLSERAPR